jgi:hypothetical protein
MQHPIGALIGVAFCAVASVVPGRAASSYDGTWSGQFTGGGNCVGAIVTLTVMDGVSPAVSGVGCWIAVFGQEQGSVPAARSP